MHPKTQDRIFEELSAYLRAGGSTMSEHPRRHSARVYTDRGRAARESQVLFRKHPLIAAVSAELENRNDFVTRRLAGIPLLLVRDSEGRVRAFHNVCRHRGNLVCSAAAGNARSFTCAYHGWTYGADGRCLGFALPENFRGFKSRDFGLREVPAEERHGLVWVQLEGAAPAMRSYLGEILDDELAGYAQSRMACFASREDLLPFNWKLGVETFLEIYHIDALHRNTIAPMFSNGAMAYERLGPHQRIAAARRSLRGQIDRDGRPSQLADHLTLIYVLFPNTVFLFQRDHIELFSFFPAASGPESCLVRTSLIRPRNRVADRAVSHWARNWKIIEDAVYGEDFRTVGDVQANVSTGAIDDFVYGRNEVALQDYHDTIERVLDGDEGRNGLLLAAAGDGAESRGQ
ncbi:MAG TPA: aromatic ring-hydroxylating dioxygenase subunit alpha [Allosphingosinicella sp.]|jgi:phenylpropionate dioxygenase-like ring-hydroxylating dioxygenase large terminal subunit